MSDLAIEEKLDYLYYGLRTLSEPPHLFKTKFSQQIYCLLTWQLFSQILYDIRIQYEFEIVANMDFNRYDTRTLMAWTAPKIVMAPLPFQGLLFTLRRVNKEE